MRNRLTEWAEYLLQLRVIRLRARLTRRKENGMLVIAADILCVHSLNKIETIEKPRRRGRGFFDLFRAQATEFCNMPIRAYDILS